MYSLDTKLLVGLSLGSIYLVAFDPYFLLYNTTKGITNQNDHLAEQFELMLKDKQGKGQFITPISHYPLVCSGSSSFCRKCRTILKDFWASMLNHGVSLYLGAHWHTYQRIYPYLKNDTFSTQKGDYQSDGGYLVTVVEGVAGNDKDIV